MKKTLLAILFATAAVCQAQTTHMVNWFMGVSSAETVLTIETGDTVMWMWADGAPHTVTSLAGATETFNSGTLSGVGQMFEHTFNTAGVSGYRCNIHAMMQGQITVNALSSGENRTEHFKFAPNPVENELTISANANIGRVQVVDATGRKVIDMTAETPQVVVHFENFPAGMYFVTASTEKGVQNFQVVKK